MKLKVNYPKPKSVPVILVSVWSVLSAILLGSLIYSDIRVKNKEKHFLRG